MHNQHGHKRATMEKDIDRNWKLLPPLEHVVDEDGRTISIVYGSLIYSGAWSIRVSKARPGIYARTM